MPGKNMRAVFVTGTDTGVGKTLVTGLLARYLCRKGFSAVTQKWVQTGCRGFSSDVNFHLKLMDKGRRQMGDYLKLMAPYTFSRAYSPHLAAKIEHKIIDSKKIINSFRLLSKGFDFVIVEGAGGALVPLNSKILLIDIARCLKIPFLVVAQNKLGAINHTLLTVEALKKRDIKILGVIFNNLKDEDKIVLKDNPIIIKKLCQETILGNLNWEPSLERLYADFIPIASKILKGLKYG